MSDYELFKKAPPLETDGDFHAEVGNDSNEESDHLVILWMDRGRVVIDTDDARALREWLDQVIPTGSGGEGT